MRKKKSYIATWLHSYIAILLCGYMAVLFTSPVAAQEVSPNRIIVRFKSSDGLGHKISRMLEGGAQFKEKLLLNDTFVFEVLKEKQEEVISDLIKGPDVIYAEPDIIYHAHETPNDEYYDKQWALPKIKADQAWDLTHGSSAVKVAVLDTGIDKDHPDLSLKVDQWVNFTASQTEDDWAGHGTHTGGIVAAVTNNEIGVAGTGYDVHLLSVKVLNDDGEGAASWIANGIKWAADNGAKVISMSLGGDSSSAMRQAIDEAWGKGVVIVASAGNESSPYYSYPAAYENVIAVAATGPNDEIASYSNYGSWVEVAAPGGNGSCGGSDGWQRCIVSTYPGGQYAGMKGTSMACPFVSGLAGLLFGVNSSLTASQVRNLIEEKADKISGTGSYWTHGRINAYQSVLAAMGNVTPTPTPQSGATPTPTGAVTPTPVPFNCVLSGDFDGSGTVDNADFELWKTAFSAGNASLSCFEYWRRNKFSN